MLFKHAFYIWDGALWLKHNEIEADDIKIANVSHPGAFSVYAENYSERSVSIDFPRIDGMENDNLEAEINQKIKDAFLSNFTANWEQEGLSVDASFKVTLNTEDYLSVLCTSEPYVAMTAHPSAFDFGITVDMHTGELLPIEAFLSLENFRLAIKNKDYLVAPNAIEEVWPFDDLADMPQFLSVINSDASNLSSYYLTEESVCYLKGIPHAYGDVATIIIPISYCSKES